MPNQSFHRTCAASPAVRGIQTLGVSNSMHAPTPLSVRIRAFFARDKEAFWWNEATNEEKKLRRMDVWQLAKVINEVRVRNLAGEAEKLIVAEHLLNVRLAQIQAKASWGSGVLGFVGAIIGAALSVSLALALQSPKDVPCTPEGANEKQAVTAPVQKLREPIAQPLKDVPGNPVFEVHPSAQGAVKRPLDGAKTKQPNP
jgi:hypothetical protein